MVNVDAQFQKAVSIVRTLPPDGKVKPTQDQQLEFYAHFKQANEGDNNTPAPGTFDFAGKYKHKAWKALAGMTQEDAKVKYIELLRAMLLKVDDDASKGLLADLEAAGEQP